jgi:hypothetical protein
MSLLTKFYKMTGTTCTKLQYEKIEIEIFKYIRNLTLSIYNVDSLLFVDFVDRIKHTKLVIRRIFIPIYVCSDNRTG